MRMPVHIGFIMDGNRRWARAQGLPSFRGHYAGYEKLLEVVDWCIERGISVASFFAFSTENWSRSKTEVSYLLRLVEKVIEKHRVDFADKGIRVVISGVADHLSSRLQNVLEKIQKETAKNSTIIVHICFNYGGRIELVEAVKRLVQDHVPVSRITEAAISARLFQQLPDPDLIVRTSGEQRLSNFLMWQGAYAELLFIDAHWPALTKRQFSGILMEYASRQRRFGA